MLGLRIFGICVINWVETWLRLFG